MTKGRKPTAGALKKIRGTDQPSRRREILKTDRLVKANPPTWLKDRTARKFFKEKANQLIALEILTVNDLEQLAIYCQSLAMAIEAAQAIGLEGNYLERTNKKTGQVKFIINPNIKIYSDMVAQVNKIGGEFGFTPVSRQRIPANKPKEEGDDFNNLMGL